MNIIKRSDFDIIATQMEGKLYLIPNFIGNFDSSYLPARTIAECHKINHFIVERVKTARQFLKAINHPTPQDNFIFHELDKHANYDGFQDFFKKHISTNSVGMLSEAGLPAVADPGAAIVRYAHELNVKVIPLSGSSSIFLALMASGTSGQQFTFNGYLAIDKGERIGELKKLEKNARHYSQIFMEAPYRNNAMLELLIQTLLPGTLLTVAVDIETDSETIISKPISDWNAKDIDLHKRPCIFIIKT